MGAERFLEEKQRDRKKNILSLWAKFSGRKRRTSSLDNIDILDLFFGQFFCTGNGSGTVRKVKVKPRNVADDILGP
jgi:hypothetical protein